MLDLCLLKALSTV